MQTKDVFFMIFEYAFISRSYIIVLRTICVRIFFVGLFEGKGKKIITDLVLVIFDVLFSFLNPLFLLFNIFKKILFFILLLLDLVIYSVMPLFYANKRQDFSSFISIKRKIFFFFMPLQKSGF